MATGAADLQTALGERYQLDRELGRGGMATVYLAHDLRLGRDVAVKVLHPELGAALGIERFRREIDIASRLSHPHILPIDDFGGAEGTLFFVMPYVAGETLAAKLHAVGMLGVEEAVRITCQVARALDHAHRHGVIHRDVKPENILLEDGEARLADFGIAHAISGADEQRLTQTGVTLGTPVYMSPEQAMADRTLDGRSDVYSLGCVLYEMLAGQPPFAGPTAQAIIARQMLGEVPSITVVRGTVPDAVEDAVLRALAKVPADRFASALEFADALEHSLATAGRSLGRADRRNRSRRRPPVGRKVRTLRVAAAVALVGILAAAGAAGAWWLLATGDARALGATTADALPPQRLGVLYFDDLSPDGSLGAVADGLTEALIEQLRGVAALDVVSRNGVAPFRGATAAPDSVAAALKAGTLVLGSVDSRGGSLRVTVRLVDGASGADTKRASFTVPAARALAARDSLVEQVARFLRSRVGEEVRVRSVQRGTADEGAWTMALQAEQLAKRGAERARGGDTAGATAAYLRADSLLADAARRDPAWSEPVVQRGQAALRLSRLGSAAAAVRWTDAGLQLADQALALDARLAAALALRGQLRLERWTRHLEPDARAARALLADAERDLKQATELDPHDAAAWSALASAYYQKPNLIEATLASQRAYEEDAYLADADRILWRLYTTAYDRESFVDAAHWCDEGRRRFADSHLFVRCQLWLFTTDARTPDAAAAWRLRAELQRLTPEGQWSYVGREAQMLVGAAIGRAGLRDSADRVLQAARADAHVDPDRELLTVEAFVRDLLGERDAALELLKQYLLAHPEHRSGFASPQGSWWWRGMRTDPRFVALVGAAR